MAKQKNSHPCVISKVERNIATITLNRPEVHNAFDDVMILELIKTFNEISKDKTTRIVVLTSSGSTFSAGADVNWMKRMKSYTYEENLKDAGQLANLMHIIYTLLKPTIARIQGPVYGGGIGLVAVCDFAIAVDTAHFRLSEVALGLSPATISPYLIKRMGERVCRELFLTADKISAEVAQKYGLVNQVVPPDKLDQAIQDMVNKLLANSPKALASCKELLHKVPEMSLEEAKSFTVKMLASLRIGDEAQEGLSAFLEKRKPSWDKSKK